MTRETKEFTTSVGTKFTLYTYLTAGESNAIKAVMMAAMKIDISDLQSGVDHVPMKGQIDGTILMEQEKLLVKYLVKEPQTGIDEIRESDYQELVTELNKIRSGNLAPAK